MASLLLVLVANIDQHVGAYVHVGLDIVLGIGIYKQR